MSKLRKWGIARGVLCLYMVMSISMPMTLSNADIKGAYAGVGILAIIYAIWALISACIGHKYIQKSIERAVIIAAVLSVGLIFDITLLFISTVVGVIF